MNDKRAEQILNDISEDMCTAKRAELIEVIRWQMNREVELVNHVNEIRYEAIRVIGSGMDATVKLLKNIELK